MKDLIPIYCQEYCPLNKHCKFGDAYPDSLPIHESHKCRFKKTTGKDNVDVLISDTVA